MGTKEEGMLIAKEVVVTMKAISMVIAPTHCAVLPLVVYRSSGVNMVPSPELLTL